MPVTARCLTARCSAIKYKWCEHVPRVIVRCEARQRV